MTDPFFAVAADATGPGEHAPLIRAGCRITPLIDAAAYNAALGKQLDAMTSGANGETILIANWWLGLRGARNAAYATTSDFSPGGSTAMTLAESAPYTIDAPPAKGGTRVLADELTAKARAGVDVRVMAWASPALFSSRSAQVAAGGGNVTDIEGLPLVNAASMLSVQYLRREPAIGSKAILNIACHPGGASHLKMVVFASNSSAVGFTGGIDFESGRWAHPEHPGEERWHDAAVQVEGPAVQDLYNWFCEIWQENLATPPFVFVFDGAALASRIAWSGPGDPPVTPAMDVARIVGAGSPGTQTAQVLRTVPKYDISLLSPEPSFFDGFDDHPDGCFEVEVAWRKAIAQATQYVYMEDQAFWSVDVMRWLNTALKRSPKLKLILMRPGTADPHDAPDPAEAGMLHQSLNVALLDGLGVADTDRIRLFQRYGDPYLTKALTLTAVSGTGDSLTVTTDWDPGRDVDAGALSGLQLLSGGVRFPVVGNDAFMTGTGTLVLSVSRLLNRLPVAGPGTLEQRRGLTVHSKTTIIDDHWALIGSANCMRRSLFTDLECSVGFTDTGPGTSVRDYRALLWSQHFGLPSPLPLNDLPTALKAWSDSWGPLGPSPIDRPGTVQEILLPLAPTTLTPLQQKMIDTVTDPDSRQTWGWLDLAWDKWRATRKAGSP